jgi:hypothetical protein
LCKRIPPPEALHRPHLDARLYTLSPDGLLLEACRRLAGVSRLTRDEMRLANYPDSMAEIDVCEE